MKMVSFFVFLWSIFAIGQNQKNYATYHRNILKAETLIAAEQYEDALCQFTTTFETYSYVFLKDIKIATQLAVHQNNETRAFKLIEKGIAAGWSLKQIKKEGFLKPLIKTNEWNSLVKKYPAMNQSYENKFNLGLRDVTKEMYKTDQKIAWKYLFKIGQKAKERFANKKIKPHALQQMKKLDSILETDGYPGEKLIGKPEWMSTILSHHNSVSDSFVKNDTLFEAIRPRLINAIAKGELNPYEFATIEDWRIAVTYDRQKIGYGYLEYIKPEQVAVSDVLRDKLGIRSIQLRNRLVDIEEKTGMDFHLAGAGWVDGKIGE